MATDAEIRAKGIKFLPLQKYLQNPYEFPVAQEPIAKILPVPGGITNTNAFTNSGDTNSGDNNSNNFNNNGNLGNYKNIDFNERYTYNPQEFMADANNYGYGVADEDKGFFKETMGKIRNTFRNSPVDKALGKGLDFGKAIGSGIISLGTGIPFLGNALGYATRNMEDRTLGAGIIDEQGNFFDEDALNKQNALGGGYTEAARSARRRTKRISNMIKRQKANKKISEKNLFKLQEQEKAQEAVRQAAADKMQSENRQNETGGYQAGYGSDFMDGPSETIGGQNEGLGGQQGGAGGTATMGSSKDGGLIGHGGKGGRPKPGYFFGGRVNYKTGGRINFRGGGMDMGNEENQKTSAQMGNTTVSNNNYSGNDNPPNFFVEDKTSVVDTSGLKSKSPEININYTDPKNYASLKSRVYNTNILDNDDLNVDGTLSGEIGPVSYNTNFTDQGITGTNLKAGKFNADIDANKNYSIGYANNYNGIDYGTTYDSNGNLMFNAGVKFKNGGLAGLL